MNKDGRIFISKDVKFNEEEFPYLRLQTQSVTSITKPHKSHMPYLNPYFHVQCLIPSIQASGSASHNQNSNDSPEATHIATSLQPDSAPP